MPYMIIMTDTVTTQTIYIHENIDDKTLLDIIKEFISKPYLNMVYIAKGDEKRQLLPNLTLLTTIS